MSPTVTVPQAHRHTLDNGLRVVVIPDHTTPVAAVHLTYLVGSRDERPGRTGFAHLFEHLMFHGSEHVEGGELVAALGEAGAAPNAATSFDWTAYHEAVPVGALELALWFEADRMGGMLTSLDQPLLDNERDVVKNERRQEVESRPFGTAWEELLAALFPTGHPYSWMPIGSMADIDAAELADVHEFFATHYGPNNCVLTIAGDVTPERGVELAERYFGAIPRNPRVPTTTPTHLGPGTAEVRLEAAEPGPVPAVLALYRGPGELTDEAVAIAVASEILAGGNASRLVGRLVRREQVAQSIDCGLVPFHGDVTAISLGGYLTGAGTTEDFERIRDEEITRLAAEGPDAEEVARAVARLERALWEEISEVEGLAAFWGEAEAFRPGCDPITEALHRLAAVTADGVREAVATWLVPANRVVLVYRADDQADEQADEHEHEHDTDGSEQEHP